MLTYADYCRRLFGTTVQKIAVDGGFTCPNRDGTLGTTGCIFCNGEAFAPSYCRTAGSITQQIDEGIRFHARRHRKPAQYIAYFQSYSNTYAPLPVLRQRYKEALAHPKVSGLVVSTRPDCVDEEKLDYLSTLNHKHFISVEYGIESCYDRTLQRINRGHDFATAEKAVRMTAEQGIHTGAHFIIGLPGETIEDWLNGIKLINPMPINSIKFHQLQIIKGTAMEQEFQKHPEDFCRLMMEEYTELMVDIIERLRTDIIIERFASEVPPKYLSVNPWKLQRYDVLLQHIRQRLKERNVCQGEIYMQ